MSLGISCYQIISLHDKFSICVDMSYICTFLCIISGVCFHREWNAVPLFRNSLKNHQVGAVLLVLKKSVAFVFINCVFFCFETDANVLLWWCVIALRRSTECYCGCIHGWNNWRCIASASQCQLWEACGWQFCSRAVGPTKTDGDIWESHKEYLVCAEFKLRHDEDRLQPAILASGESQSRSWYM